MRLKFWTSAATQTVSTTPGGTAIFLRSSPEETEIPFLKTPWFYMGPEDDRHAGQVLAAPLLEPEEYLLTLVTRKCIAPGVLGFPRKTDMYVDGSAIEAMNRMQRFLKSHDEALELFSFTPGYSDFRAYADKRGLAFDPEEGFIDRAAAIERAQQRKLAEVRAYIEQAARPALA